MLILSIDMSQLIIITQPKPKKIQNNPKMQEPQQTPAPNTPLSILKWIRQTFYYPNCRKATKISYLRSGVAIAQILTQILPQNYHQQLLSQIEVGKLVVDTCVGNWRVIKKVIGRYVDQCGIVGVEVKDYTGEGLYYCQNQVYQFVIQVVYKLWCNRQEQKMDNIPIPKKQNISYSNTIMAHILQTDPQQPKPPQPTTINTNTNTKLPPPNNKQSNNNMKDKKQQNISNINNTNINLSQLSDIANTSYPNIYQPGGKIINIDNQQHQQPEQQFISLPPMPMEQIQLLQNWVHAKLQLSPGHSYQPHQLLGHLINSIFCSSRLNDYIIKQAHFEHGALFVYRKVLQFLINSNKAEKISRTNILDMLKTIEEQGVVRQMQYWRVIQDIHNFDRLKRHLSNPTKQPTPQPATSKQKQNFHPNLPHKTSTKTLSKCKTSKQSINTQMTNTTNNNTYLNYKYNMKDIKQAEEWLVKDLGLEHTVSKLYAEGELWGNLLVNGGLVCSILMRLKIGKVVVNKVPTNIAQVRNNWDTINKACNLRGYQSFRIITNLLHNLPPNPTPKLLINIFLHILNQFRLQHNKKYPTQINPQYNTVNCHNCPPETYLIKSNQHQQTNLKQQITQWLSQVFSIQINKQSMTINQLTQICRELLSINLYKETTKKIQENNVDKILAEMRRIGLNEYYHMRKEDVMVVEDMVRWRILSDLRWVIDGKIQFCRA